MNYGMSMNTNKNEDIQMAIDYAMYMMLSSYFDKAVCKTPLYENKLYLRYRTQKTNDQYKLEEYCLKYIEKNLIKTLPEEFFHHEVEVYLTQLPDVSHALMEICGKGVELRLYTEYHPKNQKENDLDLQKKHAGDKKQVGNKSPKLEKGEERERRGERKEDIEIHWTVWMEQGNVVRKIEQKVKRTSGKRDRKKQINSSSEAEYLIEKNLRKGNDTKNNSGSHKTEKRNKQPIRVLYQPETITAVNGENEKTEKNETIRRAEGNLGVGMTDAKENVLKRAV